MGYTHYWKFTGAKVTETDVVEVTILLKKCIEALGGKVLFPNWDENPTPTPFVLRGGDGTGEPVLNGEEIHFNGDASTDNACESFDLVPETRKDLNTTVNWHDGRIVLSSTNRFHFCKTEREPYDTVVCLALLCLKRRLGDDVEINSDGHEKEWLDATLVFNDVVSENPTLCRERM